MTLLVNVINVKIVTIVILLKEIRCKIKKGQENGSREVFGRIRVQVKWSNAENWLWNSLIMD